MLLWPQPYKDGRPGRLADRGPGSYPHRASSSATIRNGDGRSWKRMGYLKAAAHLLPGEIPFSEGLTRYYRWESPL